MQQEQEPKNRKPLEKLAEYAAGFLSNLAVAGMALAIFRGCPACFLILKGVVISSHETNRFS